MEEKNKEGRFVSPECFRAYVNAEIKEPNTLIAVSPYVGHAALRLCKPALTFAPAVKRFAETCSFSRSQMNSATKTVVLLHRRFGVAVLPDGADLQGKNGIRVFELQRFEVIYMEGVMNILEAILRLHGGQGKLGSARDSGITELLGQPARMAATVAAFSAAEDAINSPAATDKSEAFKAVFNFLVEGQSNVSHDQIDDFVRVLTSPELHGAAA